METDPRLTPVPRSGLETLHFVQGKQALLYFYLKNLNYVQNRIRKIQERSP
jgi:hypothetical protein